MPPEAGRLQAQAWAAGCAEAAVRRARQALGESLAEFESRFAAWLIGEESRKESGEEKGEESGKKGREGEGAGEMRACLQRAARLERALDVPSRRRRAEKLRRVCQPLWRESARAGLPESRRRDLLLFACRETGVEREAAGERLRAALQARLSGIREQLVLARISHKRSSVANVALAPRPWNGLATDAGEKCGLDDPAGAGKAAAELRRLAFLWRLWDGRGACLDAVAESPQGIGGAIPCLLRLDVLLEEPALGAGEEGDAAVLRRAERRRAAEALARAGEGECRRILACLARGKLDEAALSAAFLRWECLLAASREEALRRALCECRARLNRESGPGGREGAAPRALCRQLARIALAAPAGML